jgi:hypothetical protein
MGENAAISFDSMALPMGPVVDVMRRRNNRDDVVVIVMPSNIVIFRARQMHSKRDTLSTTHLDCQCRSVAGFG